MASKFTPEARAKALECFRMGLSVVETAKAIDVSEQTLKGWITRGRKEEAGEYREFVAAVEEARESCKQAEAPLTPDEHLLIVSRAARRGSVTAMKLYWDMLRADDGEEPTPPADPMSEFD